MPPLFLLDITAQGISIVVATSLALMALGADPRRTLNRLFALFALLEAAWAVFSFLLRMALWLDIGNPPLLSELVTLGFILMGPVLLMFVSRYVDRQTRLADLVVILGLVLMIPLSIPLFSHQLVFNPQLGVDGSTTMEIGSLGLVLTPLPALYFAWSLVLLWQERRRVGEPYLPFSVLVLMVGFILDGVLNVRFPLLPIMNVFSVAILGYGVVNRQIFNPLRELTAELERRVGERTAEMTEMATWLEEANETLTRRSLQLEAVTQVAREAATIHHPEALMAETVRLISDRFDLYHAAIFMLDETGEHAVLRAASSTGGQQMLERGYRVRVGGGEAGTGMVGYVAAQGEPRLTPDTRAATAFFTHPDLPGTRSEIALPLRVRDQAIGVLDMQSEEPETFRSGDIPALQMLADQLAMIIGNAQLLQQVQESLEAERRAYGELGREAWREFLRTQPDLGFIKEQDVISSAGDLWHPAMERVLRTGEPISGGDGGRNLVAPIKIHDQVIGVIDAYKPQDASDWTPEQVGLLETLADQLSVALDSARLHQDTQHREIRERIVGEVTTRIRETLDMDTILQTAAREIGESLGLHDVTIQLGVDGDGLDND